MSNTLDSGNYALRFTEAELHMLGRTADALSAYMGCVVLAEVGTNEDTEWVIFGRAIGQDEEPSQDVLHVQMAGAGARILGQHGGLDTTAETLDCEFMWAVEITEDPDERYVRLDQDGEVFDSASDLATLLPFSLQEPEELAQMQDEDEDSDDENSNGRDDRDDPDDTDDPKGTPRTLH